MSSLFLALFVAAAADTGAVASSANSSLNPRAVELFKSDWAILDWGLRFHDRDRNADLSPEEAAAGAQAFKTLADGDRDGRVTPQEFERACEFLIARY